MEEKLKKALEDIENYIKWEQKSIDKCADEIREYSRTSTPENMAMFLPGKIRELEETITRQKKYLEQLDMLRFIQKDN